MKSISDVRKKLEKINSDKIFSDEENERINELDNLVKRLNMMSPELKLEFLLIVEDIIKNDSIDCLMPTKTKKK